MVEQVVELGADIELQAFREGDILLKSRIGRYDRRTAQQRSRRIDF